jgi:hypothetical protein
MDAGLIFISHSGDIYTFRVIMFPSGHITTPILAQNRDRLQVSEVPGLIPATIAAGTSFYTASGGQYTIPENILRCQVEDTPFINNTIPTDPATIISQARSTAPVCVYQSATSAPIAPTQIPNYQDGVGHWFVPSQWGAAIIIAASRHNNFPFWTRAIFQNWWVYTGCDYSSVPLHCTNHTSEFTEYEDQGQTWLHTTPDHLGHAYNIRSCHEGSYEGYTISYVSGGSYLYSLDISGRSCQSTTPLTWYDPRLFGGIKRVGGIAPILAALFILGVMTCQGTGTSRRPRKS